MDFIESEMGDIEKEQRKGIEDPHMTKKLLFLVALIGLLNFANQGYANVLVECPCCQQIIEIESPQARRITISGDLWKCSHCHNLQVNRNDKCDFCGCRVDRD